ncbi:hypothetical protein CXK86_25360 [Paenibacillus sp. BGI2013]|jgi:hypothetical protein|uniref:hypothetical protein n=1 Tax=Paenibacillus TaxID=44249 RepID=UPI0003E21A08|nr:hypothetical protein BS614_24640 [Paenibacillus xylanexedens]ETT44514.1 hypothetical protein C170_24228 [Paenibacillus sp. FSL H7-689]OMF45107.1 hypothetical protein BK136_08230 [Paenibacillus amylolyticus]PJN61762.1 hypothetical protein PAEAM_13210 [Paenibacillus sp. GM1FR]PKQ88357.1 hypothetical protein CXK86_25360 [Paenibacillus sp. BGI2013]
MKNDDNKFNFQDRPKINVDGEKQRMRVDYPRKAHREEYGAEVAPPTVVRTGGTERAEPVPEKHEADRVMESTGKVAGYMGLAFGIASLFMWSIVLGPAAAVLGYYAYVNGRKTAGAWSIGLGVVATLSYFFMIPFAR